MRDLNTGNVSHQTRTPKYQIKGGNGPARPYPAMTGFAHQYNPNIVAITSSSDKPPARRDNPRVLTPVSIRNHRTNVAKSWISGWRNLGGGPIAQYVSKPVPHN